MKACSGGVWTPLATTRASRTARGHVIGHFMADLPVAGEAGFQSYVLVERVDESSSRWLPTAVRS
jgi:hypothetical protein